MHHFCLALGTLRALAAVAGTAALFTSCLVPPESPAARGAGAPEPNARQFSGASAELLSRLKIGWNLGNSLDVPENETAWGNPRVTPELMQAVAKAGFGVVRIPVTWSMHTGPAPDFTIFPSFMDRVAEVVDYVKNAGMHAIINLHHDGADGFDRVEWLSLNDRNGQVSDAHDEQVRARFVAVWKQIAVRFAGYGEELLFESMNEVHDGYGAPDPRYFTTINQLNQAFVDVVRAGGGNNRERHLVVPGYNTNIEHTLSGFAVPKDPASGRLILSVHYYDPYLFALQGKTHTWGSASPGNDGWGQEDLVVAQFDKLKIRFIDQGLPIIIGEYGACQQDGFDDYRRYYLEYVTKAAVDRGIVPIYWDNGAQGSGGEKFGLISRRSYEPLYPKMLEAIQRAARSSYRLADVARPVAAK